MSITKDMLIEALAPAIIKEEDISCFLCNKVLAKRIVTATERKQSQNICVDCIGNYLKG